ncbi:MAG: formylglycine-generating enzyme family protein [Acidimicrobiia bacterium]|nr:formylglycine-generating enzyme family protein [Acidimicrobiia bacterium]
MGVCSSGGLVGACYPWRDDLAPGEAPRLNIWEGVFPTSNTAEDGDVGTAPLRTFEPNNCGLYQTVGNVWERTVDRWSSAPVTGPPAGASAPPRGAERVVKGGSHLGHDSYCSRYQIAARTKNTADSSTGHLGLRLAADVSAISQAVASS